MQTLMLFALHSCAAWASYNFGPDKAESWLTPNIPTLYDLTASQFQSAPISSYYAGSFLTTTNGNQYFVVSHLLLLTQQPQSNIRHSILDITNPSTYLTSSTFVPTPPQPPANTTSGPWSHAFPNYTFSSPSSDSVSRMHTRATSSEKYSFDLSFAATSPALHNLGAGTFAFGSGNNSQWSLPACRTYGTLTIGDEEVQTVDPDRSLTWYDRQWGYVGAPPAFTWMGLRFPDAPGISLSVWAIDYDHDGDGGARQWRFATVQTPQGNMILDVAVRPDEGSLWTSPVTGKAYASRWGLEFQNGDVVNVTAVRPDQELGTGISAFVGVEGRFMGAEGGFGVVDVLG